MQHAIGSRPFHAHHQACHAHRTLNPTWLRRAGEVLIIAVAVLLYFMVRGLVDGREAEAVVHAGRLIDLERSLGIFWEPRFQAWALEWGPLATVANWVYIWGHWPVIVATLSWLLMAHRDRYPVYRNTLLISGAVGLVIFTVFPMAPPRFMVDWGFVDTVTLHSQAYRVLQPPSLVNQYAAMPSLHCGWDLLMGIAIFRHAPRQWRWIGLLLPVAMFFAVVLTANHYFTDGIVGDTIVLASLIVAGSLQAWRGRLSERSPFAQRIPSHA